MDLLVFLLPELHDWVFQHCRAVDFQEMTKVSPKWNVNLENSIAMMKKVKLTIKGESLIKKEKINELENLVNTTARCYRNLSVSIYGDMELANIVWNYILPLIPNLLELKMSGLNKFSERNVRMFDEIDFSKLKVLKLRFVSKKQVNMFLSRCISLSELKLQLYRSGGSNILLPGLKSFLERNLCLKNLELETEDLVNIFFKEDISDIVKFKLKCLKVGNEVVPLYMHEATERNFLKFLRKQSQSLESLFVSACGSNVIEFMFNEMPALKSLAIWSQFRTKDLQLDLNENIVDLSIPQVEANEDFIRIVQVVPNLEKLYVRHLTTKKIEMIKQHLPAVKTILFEGKYVAVDELYWTLLLATGFSNFSNFY